jgi:Protein of unknown function (DUF3455)
MMISSRKAHAFRLQYRDVTMVALAMLLLVFVAPAGAAPVDDNRAPDLGVGDCQKLQVPQGNKVSFHGFGVGVQIYQWNGANWIFVAPEATLFANAGDNGKVAIHFGGPTWQSNSGSKVIGKVLQHCTPDPAAIPWLLLASVPELTEGPGIFADVTYIQRVNTVGGNAPTEPGNTIGEIARVPYTADYFFYHQAGQ